MSLLYSSKELISWMSACTAASLGLVQNSSAAVIGSMAISPIGDILFRVINKNTIHAYGNFALLLLIPFISGLVQYWMYYKVLHKNSNNGKKETDQMSGIASNWTDVIYTNLLIGIIGGILCKVFPKNYVLLAGTAIILTLGPGINAAGVYTGLYLDDPKQQWKSGIWKGIAVSIFNFVGMGIGYTFLA